MVTLRNCSLQDIKRLDRCINCSMVLPTRGEKRLVKSGSRYMQTVLQSWIAPTSITKFSKLCRPCFSILASLPETIEPPSARFGNRYLCLPCGQPRRGLGKSKIVPKDCPERSWLCEIVLPHLVQKLTRVCPACWKMARVIVKMNQRIPDNIKENCFRTETLQSVSASSVNEEELLVKKSEKPKIAVRGANKLMEMKHAMILKVFHFLKAEYEYIKSINNPNHCDLNPLANIAKRTADATGVTKQTVRTILEEECRDKEEKERIQNTNRPNTNSMNTKTLNTVRSSTSKVNTTLLSTDNEIETYTPRLNTEENVVTNTINEDTVKPKKVIKYVVNLNTRKLLKQNNEQTLNTLKTNTTKTDTIKTKNKKSKYIDQQDTAAGNTINENTAGWNTEGNTFSCIEEEPVDMKPEHIEANMAMVDMDHCYFYTKSNSLEESSQDETGDLVLKFEVDEDEIEQQYEPPDIETSITTVCPIQSQTNANNSIEENEIATEEIKTEPVDENFEINSPASELQPTHTRSPGVMAPVSRPGKTNNTADNSYGCRAKKARKSRKVESGIRRYGIKSNYTLEILQEALNQIRSGAMTRVMAAKVYNIPPVTLYNKLKNKHTKPVGKPVTKNI